MNNDETLFFSILFTMSVMANLGLGIALFRAYRRARSLEAKRPEPIADERLDQIERAVDAIGAQVDQLASGQEFLNRVIANRERAPRLERVRDTTPV